MTELVVKIPAIDKLLDYLACGVGAVAGPLLLPWRANMEEKADRISARSYAYALPIIAKAQADARQLLLAPDEEVHGAVELTHEHLQQLIQFQGLKRLANIRSVVESAAEELGNTEVPDHEPDHDWTARFFDCVQDVSSEHMQKLWAKVLSGEVESPGRTSLRTLGTLRNMTQRDAELLEAVAGLVLDGEFIFYNRDIDGMRHSAVTYFDLLYLEDCGLTNVDSSLVKSIVWKESAELALPYLRGDLLISRGERASENLRIPSILLTTAGQELFRIAQGTAQMDYLEDFSTFLHLRGCQLSLIEGVETLPDGRLRYASRTPIEPRPIQPGMPAL